MTVARTARRRRKHISQGYSHLAKMGRPVYRGTSALKSERKLAVIKERQEAALVRLAKAKKKQ